MKIVVLVVLIGVVVRGATSLRSYPLTLVVGAAEQEAKPSSSRACDTRDSRFLDDLTHARNQVFLHRRHC